MKPPIPVIELDNIDAEDIKKMSLIELSNVVFDKIKWHCSIEGCECFTTVKDYGISPLFHWRKRWINLEENIYYCAKHWKEFSKSGKDDSKFNYKIGSGLMHLK